MLSFVSGNDSCSPAELRDPVALNVYCVPPSSRSSAALRKLMDAYFYSGTVGVTEEFVLQQVSEPALYTIKKIKLRQYGWDIS